MATRRPHTKSRLGCVQCKARKVKCDQAAPVCSHCARRKQNCSLTEAHLHLGNATTTQMLINNHKKTPPTPVQPTPVEQRRAEYDYTTLDLELTHWYATETWRCLQHRMKAAQLWQGSIFEMALQTPAVMDAILTTAAIHKLVTHPNSPRRDLYAKLIVEKGPRIIPDLVTDLNSPSEANCIKLLSSTILLTIWAFGSISLPPQANLFRTPEFVAQAPSPLNHAPTFSTPRLDEFLTVAQLSAGTYSVVMTMREDIIKLGYEEMIAGAPWDDLPLPSQNVVQGLNALESQCKAMAGEMSDELFSEYIVHIQRLHQMFQAASDPDWYDVVVGYVIRFPKMMVSQLAQRKPLALVVLAYWAAALKTADGTWWIHGWPRGLFEEIHEGLDAEWRSHLRAPAQFFN